MTTTPDLDHYRTELVERCRTIDGITSLVFFGSASTLEAARRDEWSDLDFTLFATPEAAPQVRDHWPFLPAPERIVLGCRELDGGVVIYDDGFLLEFGAGLPWELRDPSHDIVLDGGDLVFADPPAAPDPANEIRLFLAKLYIGMGRLRRGERVAANAHIRTYALGRLCWALRLRLAPDASGSPFDPLRRFEASLPDVGARLGATLDADLESCGHGLFTLARELLEPGWPDFPSDAADVISRRLGWTDR